MFAQAKIWKNVIGDSVQDNSYHHKIHVGAAAKKSVFFLLESKNMMLLCLFGKVPEADQRNPKRTSWFEYADHPCKAYG